VGGSSYSLFEKLQLSACTNCRICADVCPAAQAAGDGQLSGAYRLAELRKNLNRSQGLMRKLFGLRPPSPDRLKAFSETVFRCTLCGHCQEVCPAGIRLKDIWFSLRHALAVSETCPGQVNMIREHLLDTRNVFGEDNEERAEWVEDMDEPPDHGFIKDRAEVVYFTGCVSSYFPLAQKIPINLAEIMEIGGVDFTLLGEDEWCCGFPFLTAGLKDPLPDFINHNMEAIRARGATKIVFACPTCYQTWKHYYPPEFELAHSSEFLIDLVGQGRIPLRELSLKVTFHDPCDLGRGARVFEEPRQAIRSIPGVELIELERNRENCRCCGGGGSLEMFDADLSDQVAARKIEEVLETGAQAVVTSCQQCVRTMTGHVRRNKLAIEVLDLTELVRRAIDKQE